MGKECKIETVSYAIDNNDNSRLLTDINNVSSSMLGDSVALVPPTYLTYSLFSANSLFLNQD